jgi:hypothetical protein
MVHAVGNALARTSVYAALLAAAIYLYCLFCQAVFWLAQGL